MIEPSRGGGVPKVIVVLLLSIALAAFLFGLYTRQHEREFNKAVRAYNGGKYTDVISTLNQVIQREPENAEAFLLRCRAYYQMRDSRHAKEDCTRAISFAPDNENPYYYRGLALMELEKPEQAADDFRRVLELNPDHPFADDLKKFIGEYGPPGA